ncbi:MAG: MBL fold metallo-hydrolase [Acidobacteriota bacterium]
MHSIRPQLALAAGLGSAVSLAGAGWLGWLQPRRSWPAATGWHRIPPPLRASIGGPLWTHASAPSVDWLGHSTMIVEWAGRRLVLDPHVRGHCTITRRILAPPIELAALEPVDAVLLSHAHFDHLDPRSLRALLDRPQPPRLVVPSGTEAFVPRRWRRHITTLAIGESTRVGELGIEATPAIHGGGRFHPFKSGLAVGFAIRRRDDVLFYAGDTALGPHIDAVAQQHRPRAAILPIGAYLPRWPMRGYHMSPDDAVEAARRLGCEIVVPCHFGTFVLSLDRPWDALPRFAERCAAAGVGWRMPRFLAASP